MLSEQVYQVGDKGFVRLDASMADDMSVVNAARVSFARQQEEMDDSAKGLIHFLMREQHGTPFEHNSFRFHIKCPIFVAREWFRHRIGSFNEFSARYSEVPNEFYIPELKNVRSQVGKPGAYTFEPVDEALAMDTARAIGIVNEYCYQTYISLLERGVAKEVARCVLPVSMYTQFYWTVNARALMNFLALRSDKNALLEIREFAEGVDKFFREAMPITYIAWVMNDRVCP